MFIYLPTLFCSFSSSWSRKTDRSLYVLFVTWHTSTAHLTLKCSYYLVCLKLRMCHSSCCDVGVFPRYCTCKWSWFSEERRTKLPEIAWPCCIMHLFVTGTSEDLKAVRLCARIWISNYSSAVFVSSLDCFLKTCFTWSCKLASRTGEHSMFREHGMLRQFSFLFARNPLHLCPNKEVAGSFEVPGNTHQTTSWKTVVL